MSPVRCAIYTRKSSEEGLEQGFNSLDAQREACAAYILSQASEGWEMLPAYYDDGGISGGTLERPALQQLLADVAAGQIDIIVVYKVDRLTRSLLDFAKLVEALDKAGTSFVSITQSFNTTTSMGRLTLNMLLSFAQFEREVTAERIRDKISASKAKGMWMGGVPPLGYQPDGRSLVIKEDEASLIRHIYSLYQKLGNVRLVSDKLIDAQITVPQRMTLSGRSIGGGKFSRGQLHAILKNPIYAGDIGHHGKIYPGNHDAIITRSTWDAVQAQIAGHIQGSRKRKARKGSAADLAPGKRTGSKLTGAHPASKATTTNLAGLLVDEHGERLVATHTTKGAQQYRYYVSKSLHHGTVVHGGNDSVGDANADHGSGVDTGAVTKPAGLRLPAREIEQMMARELAALFTDPIHFAERTRLPITPETLPILTQRCNALVQDLGRGKLAAVLPCLASIRVLPQAVVIELPTQALAERFALPLDADAPALLTLTCAVRLTRTGRAVRLVQDNGTANSDEGSDAALLRLLLKARAWWAILAEGQHDITALASKEGVTVSYITRVVRLAFLAPRVVEGIMAGRLRAGINARALLRANAIHSDWDIQEQQLLAASI